jgi:hypothetical protein
MHLLILLAEHSSCNLSAPIRSGTKKKKKKKKKKKTRKKKKKRK